MERAIDAPDACACEGPRATFDEPSMASRTTSCGWARWSSMLSSGRGGPWSSAIPSWPTRSAGTTPQVNELQRQVNKEITTAHRHAGPGRPRRARAPGALPRLGRARAHGRLRGQHRQARPAAGERAGDAHPQADSRRWSRSVASSSARAMRALVDISEEEAREVCERDDELDHLYNSVYEDAMQLMTAAPGARPPGDPHALRRPSPRAARRPGHEHRRGRRLPGDRAGRGPQPLGGDRCDGGCCWSRTIRRFARRSPST